MKGLKPKEGQKYYSIERTYIYKYYYNIKKQTWYDYEYHWYNYYIGNYFLTKKEAKKVLKKIRRLK